MPSKDKRKLAAIMFADVVGYSRMMASNEERTLELLKDFENICSPIIVKHDGEIIKKVGDELFCEFSSAKQAVDSALAIQEAIQPYNDSRPKDFKLHVRIGIHVGDIVLRDGDVFGDGVNVASRIQPFANPGGICVSNTVRDALSSHPNYDIESEGKQELKNIIEKHTLYSIKTGFEDKTIIKKYKKSKKTIPVLICILSICIVGILFFGDSLNIWEMDKNISDKDIPNVHLIYIGSLEEDKYIAQWRAKNFLSKNEGAKIFSLDELELKNLRSDIEADLYSEFYNQNLTIKVLKNDEEIRYVNNSIKKHGEKMETLAGSIYKFFDQPTHIIFIRVYAIKSIKGEILQYAYDVFGAMGDGWYNIMHRGAIRETIKEIESSILEGLVGQIIDVKHNFARGKVINIEGNYVYINPMGLKMKKNMNLTGYRKWSHNDNDGDGFTDKDSSYYKWINDVKEALDYVKSVDDYDKIEFFQKKYDKLTSDSLRSVAKGESWSSHNYSLKVISVKDSMVIAELIEAPPWVEVNIGDGVRVK